MNRQPASLLVALALIVVLGGCSQSNSGDPQEEAAGTSDTDRFWIFPNPNKDPATGVYQSNDAAYAQAYYAAIDPGNSRATLDGFKTVNGFGTSVAGVTEVNVIFRDVRDLGYGRKMTVRFTDPSAPGYVAANHWVAVFVENYQVVPFAGNDYTSLNLEAAIVGHSGYHVGTNAIEYSIVGGRPMTRFYTYAPGTGARLNTVNLDGRGQKAMPSVCINCHGGRADPLSVAGVFPNGGNVRARMQPINVDSVEFWSAAPYRRVDQEEALRQINYAILCAHSYHQGLPAAAGVDTCRPVPAGANAGHDYQGAAGDMMKAWYAAGIDAIGATFSDNYVPGGWTGQESLYRNVVAPYCRVCHQLRGTENQRAIDFTTYDTPDNPLDITTLDDFRGYADRIKEHVFVRGNMPLGLIIYNEFWESDAPEQLADWLASVDPVLNPARVGGGSTGRPVQPSGLLTDPSLLAAGVSSTPDYPAFPKPTTFATIKAIIRNTNTVGCTGCHLHSSNSVPANTYGVGFPGYPPIAYDDYDRDGDGDAVVDDSNDDYEFYKALRARVNLTDYLASPLLRKPTGNHHGGGKVIDFTLTASPTYDCQSGVWPDCVPFSTLGEYNQAVYNTFLDWIQHGAPYSYTGSTPNY